MIFGTDIGGDIDDTWALAHFVRSPELDVTLIVSSNGDTPARARIAVKLLEVANRTDIPLGIGVLGEDDGIHHGEWARLPTLRLSRNES